MHEITELIKSFPIENASESEMKTNAEFALKYGLYFADSENKLEMKVEEFVKESFKYLRIICTKGTSFQNLIMNTPNSLKILKNLIENEKSSEDLKLKTFQLVANLCVNNQSNQKEIWSSMKDLIISKFEFGDSKTVNVTGMIIYNIILEKSCALDERKIATICLSHYEKYLNNHESESLPDFVQIILEHSICDCVWIVEYFKRLELKNQKNLLYFVNDHIENESNKEIHSSFMNHIILTFQVKSDCILKTVTTYVEQINPDIVVILIEIISSAVSQEKYMKNLRENHSLFLNLGCLLQMLHKIGKNSPDSIYTPIQKLDAVAPAGKHDGEFEKEISFSMKTKLVKCLANLLHKNPRNQELVREMEILHCILECTIADARNPLIKEWSVLAIKNICDDNPENQEIIKNLTKLKNVENPTLKEMGIDVGTLRIGK